VETAQQDAVASPAGDLPADEETALVLDETDAVASAVPAADEAVLPSDDRQDPADDDVPPVEETALVLDETDSVTADAQN
jgi:hypothetical protein